jgi:hypothetical protein
MNAYFFNVTKEERENILDKHKTLYDGYVTMQNKPNNLERLTVQDLANDKGGITLNNKGEVTTYKNFGINEEVDTLDEACWSGYKQVGTKKKNGKTVPNCIKEEIEEETCSNCGLNEDICECNEEIIDNVDLIDEVDEDLKESFKLERDTILDVFNRFKKFN